MAILEDISSFENIKQIIYFFQSFSIPEHYYLENWIVYYTALKILLTAAIISYGSFILLKSFIFKSIMGLDDSLDSDDLQTFTFEASRFFARYFIYFLIFGLIFFILGIPIPSKHDVKYLIFTGGISFVFVVVLTSFCFVIWNGDSRDGDSWDGDSWDGDSLLLPIFFVIFVWLGGCFLTLDVAYVISSNDINGHIYTYMDSDYRDGDPISVKIGGPDTGLSVFLLHDDPEGLKQISSLYLYSNNSSTQFNNTLIGYSQGPGDYKISLNNTTSLPSGHYRLIFENPKYNWINTSNHFSLQN